MVESIFTVMDMKSSLTTELLNYVSLRASTPDRLKIESIKGHYNLKSNGEAVRFLLNEIARAIGVG